MKLLQIGFGNMVSVERIVSLIKPDSAPVKRMVQEAKEQGVLIDATYGRKTASILVMDSGHFILSGLSLERILTKNEEIKVLNPEVDEDE